MIGIQASISQALLGTEVKAKVSRKRYDPARPIRLLKLLNQVFPSHFLTVYDEKLRDALETAQNRMIDFIYITEFNGQIYLSVKPLAEVNVNDAEVWDVLSLEEHDQTVIENQTKVNQV